MNLDSMLQCNVVSFFWIWPVKSVADHLLELNRQQIREEEGEHGQKIYATRLQTTKSFSSKSSRHLWFGKSVWQSVDQALMCVCGKSEPIIRIGKSRELPVNL
jgi:hypothetical protein